MDVFLDEFVRTIFQVIAPIIAALIVAVLVQIARKFSIELSAEQQARTEKIVHDAIFFAEEKAAAALKKEARPVLTKLHVATARVLDKIPGITEDEAGQLVHQELPKVGLGAAGFSRSVVQAATNDIR